MLLMVICIVYVFVLAANKLLVDKEDEISQLIRQKEGIKLCYF